MRKFIVLMMAALLVLLVGALTASAQSCMISVGVGKPLLPDTDCDRIVDREDNCPFIANPMQTDSDGNGLGDACDLLIESIRTSPADFVYNGRAFNTFVTLENNRDYNIRNLKVRVFMPELGIESVQYVDNLKVCGSQTVEFFLRAPMCVPMNDYKIVVEASFMNIFGDTEVIPGITSIRVVPDKYCQAVMQNNQEIGNTFIDVMEIQDVYKGAETVFPIRISNLESTDKDYIITATGFDGWGSYRISSGSLVIVPSESQRMADLYVTANQDIPPGERVFLVSVQSGEEIQRFLLIANVKESMNANQNYGFLMLFGLKTLLIGGIVLLIIIALIIGIKKYVDSIRGEPAQYY
jgi:hypothetical protein